VISDRPPTGKVRQQRKIEAETPAANATAGKTAADREMEFRKRQKESREAAEKAEKEQRATARKNRRTARRTPLAAGPGVRRTRGDARQQGRTLLPG
jgi:hypothetical protein